LLSNGHSFVREFLKMSAQETQVALPLRAHTILGVCEAIGEDFGFNPTFLRVPFAASVLWSPLWAIVAYFALGAVVLLSRLLFPKAETSAPAIEQSYVEANTDEPKLPLAA
jgi:phage shock protein PspC (stress-responsive transcriptional regulator)